MATSVPAVEKRVAGGNLPEDDEEKSKKQRFAFDTGNIYSRPVAGVGTRYALHFRPSDYELFNQELVAWDLSKPREVRSGLTPRNYPVEAPILTPLTHTRIEEFVEYQRVELMGWESVELVDLEVIEAIVKPSNLSNEIHPILRKERWGIANGERNSPYTLQDGRLLDPRDDDIWPCMIPVLRLASQFMANLHLYDWWDAMWEGRREKFPHPDGPRYVDLTRFFKREGEERLANPARLERYANDITWDVALGQRNQDHTWDGVTWTCWGVPRQPHISISGGLIEPFLRQGALKLTTAQEITQNFILASLLLHELSHACQAIEHAHQAELPPQLTIKDDPPTASTQFDTRPVGVFQIITEECYKGESTEQEAHRAFRNKWRVNLRTMSQAERERAEERLEELLTSKEYWESIRKLRGRRWFARTGSNLYKEIKELVQPGTISEQHLNADLKELYSKKYYGELDDYLTGNDYAAAILWLREERFFKAPEVFENYYMDEDVSESGYSSLNSVLGGQVGHTPEFPRDRLHREALAKASMGFKPYTEIIPDPLDNTQPRTIYHVVISPFPIYRRQVKLMYSTAPILNPEKFDDPRYEHKNWPVPLSYIEEIQQEEFWKIACTKYGGEMVKVNPKICGRRFNIEKGQDLILDLSSLSIARKSEPFSTEDKYKLLKQINTRRIAQRILMRKNQTERQGKVLQKAIGNRAKQVEIRQFLAKRYSEKMAYYGSLAAEKYKEKKMEDMMKRFHVDFDEQLQIFGD